MIIRKPAVAGQFYPGDKNELKDLINSFLDKAKAIKTEGQLSVLIVPHAGLVFSGQTAAFAFKQIKDKKIKNVFLLGVSHSSFFPDIAIDNSDYWQTPLGQVRINQELAKKIISEGIDVNRQAHLNEHSLEIEVPFLQTVLTDFSILPILIGQIRQPEHEKTWSNLVKKISENFNDKILLIISSDLSHYPDEETARLVDARTIKAIKKGEINFFEEELERLSFDFPEVETFACGAEAIKVGMMVAKKLGALKVKVLAKTNSGEVTGDTSRVVGYAAMGFYK